MVMKVTNIGKHLRGKVGEGATEKSKKSARRGRQRHFWIGMGKILDDLYVFVKTARQELK